MKKLILILILFFTCFGISAPISAHGYAQTEVGKVESARLDTLTLTKDNVLFVIKQLGLHHPEIVMKQAILETGHLTSKLCVKFGNLFGIKKNGKYAHYKHWTQSIRDYKDLVQYKYKRGEDYYKFLTRIGYAEDPNYISKVKKIQI